MELMLLNTSPAFDTKATLEITSLAPLSMVSKMPGKYYTSSDRPTKQMIYGMLENAIGWHIGQKERDALLKALEKKHKRKAEKTGVGFGSLLQWHVRVGPVEAPPLMSYDDLWTQHLRGNNFAEGSRNHDAAAIPFMNGVRSGRLKKPSDKAAARKDADAVINFKDGDEVSLIVLRQYFPQYYSSPTLRGYIVPEAAYHITIETSPEIAAIIREAVENPAAPLYLGSNDGWVEIHYHG